MRQAAKYIMQREGIGGFFKGYIPTLARGVSCNAVVFPVYGESKTVQHAARWCFHSLLSVQSCSSSMHSASKDRQV